MNRRDLLTAGVILASLGAAATPAAAQGLEKASAFVQQTGNNLVAIVNGSQAAAEKRRSLAQVLNAAVDVDGIGRFCLGRYWRNATVDQQSRYLTAFHEVLVSNISSKLGEYRGVKVSVLKGREQEDTAIVTTVVERPNNPPTTVDWVIGQPASAPKIVDVLAEGTSLRLTQRQDYAAYLSRNNNDIDALIKAMSQQVGKS